MCRSFSGLFVLNTLERPLPVTYMATGKDGGMGFNLLRRRRLASPADLHVDATMRKHRRNDPSDGRIFVGA